jgi:hypothetical protein
MATRVRHALLATSRVGPGARAARKLFRAQELLDSRVGGSGEHSIGGPQLHDAPIEQHRYPVCQGPCFRAVTFAG